jgi:hypothetical protein
MIIGEAVSDEFLKEIVTQMQQHVTQVQGLLHIRFSLKTAVAW